MVLDEVLTCIEFRWIRTDGYCSQAVFSQASFHILGSVNSSIVEHKNNIFFIVVLSLLNFDSKFLNELHEVILVIATLFDLHVH